MNIVVESVYSAISLCTEHSASGDISDLDMILASYMSTSSQVGMLLDEILVTRQRRVEEEVLTVLRHLHICLNQLCVEYEKKLFIAMSTSPGRNTTTISGYSRGRPKKIINLGLVMLKLLSHTMHTIFRIMLWLELIHMP